MSAKTAKNTGAAGKFFRRIVLLRETSYAAHEWIAFGLLLIMALQPLQGIIRQAYSTDDIVMLFAARRDLIRALGYGLLGNALVFYCRRLFTEGAGILKKTFVERPWNTLLLLLLIWSYICVWHAPDQEIALMGDAVRFEGVLSYIAYAGFFAGGSMIKGEDLKMALYVAMGTVATLLGALSLWCLYNPSSLFLVYMNGNIIGGLSGTFVNTNHYGYYLCIMAILLFGLIPLTKNRAFKALFALMGAFQVVVLLFNNTLGGMVAVAAGLLALLLLYAIRKGGRTKRTVLLGLALVLVVCLAFAAFCVLNPEMGSLTRDVARMVSDIGAILSGTASGSEGSSRWGLWKACVEYIKLHPLKGCGTDNAYYCINETYFEQKMPHNEYLQMGVNMGVPAMVLYLGALFLIFFNRLFKLRRLPDVTVTAFCVTFTYAVSAFFGVSLCTMLPFFYLFLALTADDTGVMTKAQLEAALEAPAENEAEENEDAKEADEKKKK